MTIHCTAANPTDRLRRAIGLVYFVGRARIDEAAMKQRQAKVFAEWETKGQM